MGKRDRAGQRRGPRSRLVIARGTVALAAWVQSSRSGPTPLRRACDHEGCNPAPYPRPTLTEGASALR
jgi:hypothetical protein